jgi:hypothetical protein
VQFPERDGPTAAPSSSEAAPAQSAPPPNGGSGNAQLALSLATNLARGNTVTAGLAAAELSGRVVEALGQGEARGNLARVLGPSAVPALVADQVAREVLARVGVEDERARKAAGQVVATAVAAAPAVPLVLAAQLGGLALQKVSPQAREAVGNVLRELDPTSSRSLAGQVVGGIGSAVKSLFGGGSKKEERPPQVLRPSTVADEARWKAQLANQVQARLAAERKFSSGFE